MPQIEELKTEIGKVRRREKQCDITSLHESLRKAGIEWERERENDVNVNDDDDGGRT